MSEPLGSGPRAAELGAPVEVRVAAELAQLPVLRAMAETITLLSEFNLDEISDVTLAVDQICSDLIADAVAGAELVCRFQLTDGVLNVAVSTNTRTADTPDRQGFGWHVLRTLTDSIAVTREALATSGPGYHTTVELSKAKGGE
ncbi:ATP-binding protein [Rhodococcus sp. NPDC059234]|uniref:ATP-binding protein n=1 Tax=Rhodococcus sp. NPDC059234 TaxID=3346781 RepID=UPI00366C2669